MSGTLPLIGDWPATTVYRILELMMTREPELE